MIRRVASLTIECVIGDIASQEDIDAVVNAANAELRPGGGVAGALHRAAGPGLEEEATILAPIEPGQAVVTSGHGLPNRWVIHCLGPVYGRDDPPERLLASCYLQALRLAEEHGVRSIAFPAISTGAFGYPIEEATRIALETAVVLAPALHWMRRIRFVVADAATLAVYERTLLDFVEGRE